MGLVAGSAVGLPATAPAVVTEGGGCDRFGPPPASGSALIGQSRRAFLSSDGRFVVFTSWHPLVDDDTNGAYDAFRYDRVTGEIVRLGLENTGGELRRGAMAQAVSDDGDRVLFLTGSPDIAGERSEGQLFLRKVAASKTELVSANVEGRPTNGPVAVDADISPDGRWVAFSSQGTDLVPDDPRTNEGGQFAGLEVYLRDLQSNTTVAVTSPHGAYAFGTTSYGAHVSRDGRFVAFTSLAPWTADDTHPLYDAYVWDRFARRYELASVDASGRAIGGEVYGMSDDGRMVVFRGTDVDGNGAAVYVRDRALQTTRLLHEDHEPTFDPSVAISGDGRVVAIQTLDPIDERDSDGRDDVVLVDTHTGEARPVGAVDPSCSPDAGVFEPQLSTIGTLLVVDSVWTHVENSPDRREIFLFDIATRTWTQITPQVIQSSTAPAPGPGDHDREGGGREDDPLGEPGGMLPLPPSPQTAAPALAGGYWMLTAAGGVHVFGDARFYGSGTGAATDLEPTPAMDGYWILHPDGLVTARGLAPALGRAQLGDGERATSLSATPSGRGYWIFTSSGRVVPLGDAAFFGDMVGVHLNGPVLDSVSTPTGKGYFMVASDGGIFAFGDARFAGSMGGKPLNAPVQSLVPDRDGSGYWLVASDGGVFAFDAPFRGSMGGQPLNRPVTGMVPFGDGYLMVGEDGGIFNFSDREFLGSLGADPPAQPIVSVAVLDQG